MQSAPPRECPPQDHTDRISQWFGPDWAHARVNRGRAVRRKREEEDEEAEDDLKVEGSQDAEATSEGATPYQPGTLRRNGSALAQLFPPLKRPISGLRHATSMSGIDAHWLKRTRVSKNIFFDPPSSPTHPAVNGEGSVDDDRVGGGDEEAEKVAGKDDDERAEEMTLQPPHDNGRDEKEARKEPCTPLPRQPLRLFPQNARVARDELVIDPSAPSIDLSPTVHHISMALHMKQKGNDRPLQHLKSRQTNPFV